MLGMIEVVGAVGIALLLIFRFTGQKAYAFWGQILLIVSFSLIAFVLIKVRSFWIGAAFAISAFVQIYALASTRIRKGRDSSMGK